MFVTTLTFSFSTPGWEPTLGGFPALSHVRTVEGTDILVAVGRTPNTQELGLEEAGIELTEKGHIRVNDRLETSRRMSGQSENALAARTSRMYLETTFRLSMRT
jgi:pyridine nucleotide-disulfide oxidoreductase